MRSAGVRGEGSASLTNVYLGHIGLEEAMRRK
jgi:hypothetical protein